MQPTPVVERNRIASLDVIRGFALLGILLLNILGFGLLSAGYFNPEVGSGSTARDLAVNMTVWAGVDVLFEGAMRCLFSMLFGAGVILFTQAAREREAALHYRRNFWLLTFGLFDAYVLLWNGDVLLTYALAGMVLYPLRKLSSRKLVGCAVLLVVLMSLMNAVFSFGLNVSREAGTTPAGTEVEAVAEIPAEAWTDFLSGYDMSDIAVTHELIMRRDSYTSAFEYNAGVMTEIFGFVLPVILFWDALAMMLLGMALFRWGVLDASRSRQFHIRLMVVGFTSGLAINLYELAAAYSSGLDPLAVHGYMRPTYHLGRIGMALGYIGLVMLMCQSGWLAGLQSRLAAVGRMALTNYLMHSLICLFLFTGAGFALVGELQRWQLYPIVLVIWLVQLYLSPWWLQRFQFGPVEWFWRSLTYGRLQGFRR